MLFRISTPGRVCLFGEHQDYLGLPIIAAAIDLRLELTALATLPDRFLLEMPDLNTSYELPHTGRQQNYVGPNDFLRAVYNLLLQEGVSWSQGLHCAVTSRIPINAGTSSSTALVLSWTAALLAAADDPRATDAEYIAWLAYRAEVDAFGGRGGMMDQYACAVGELIYLDPQRPVPTRMPNYLGTFVLGDSCEPKDTQGILGGVRAVAESGVRKLKKANKSFDLRRSTHTDIYHHLRKLTDRERVVMEAVIGDRDLLRQAFGLLRRPDMSHRHLGTLLNEHHRNLSHKKMISTPKIERMLQAAKDAGALGGKINGSGGGGCMFAYAPEHPEKVAAAIEDAGGRAFVVTLCPGLTVHRSEGG